MKPIFSLRLVKPDESVFGWNRIDVLQIFPSGLSQTSVMSKDPSHPRKYDFDYGFLYLGDGTLSMGSFDDDLFPEIDDGVYELIPSDADD